MLGSGSGRHRRVTPAATSDLPPVTGQPVEGFVVDDSSQDVPYGYASPTTPSGIQVTIFVDSTDPAFVNAQALAMAMLVALNPALATLFDPYAQQYPSGFTAETGYPYYPQGDNMV